MKKYFLILCILFSTIEIYAQNNNVKPFEVELGLGISKGGKFNNTSSKAGLSLFVEPRYNFKNTPFDLGLQISLASFDRDGQIIKTHKYNEHIMPRTITVYGDYNFRKWDKLSLFGGLGVGYSQIAYQYETDDKTYFDRDSGRKYKPVFSARIGTEVINHIRLTFDYKLINKQYSFFGITIGAVIGGGKSL